MCALVVKNLRVGYGREEILKGFSLDVGSGETVAIIGRSGSGKSTLLRAICALQPAKDGDVLLSGQKIIKGGKSLFQDWEIRRHVMMVAQTPSLIPHLTTLRNISLGLECVLGLSRAVAVDKARELANELGIGNVLESYPEELSGGQLQRANLARAIVLQPQFLLLDEITSAIDPETTIDVINALYRLRSLMVDRQQTCLIVTHHLAFACDFANRIVFLNDGVSYEEGESRSFASTARKPETIRFLDAVKESSQSNM